MTEGEAGYLFEGACVVLKRSGVLRERGRRDMALVSAELHVGGGEMTTAKRVMVVSRWLEPLAIGTVAGYVGAPPVTGHLLVCKRFVAEAGDRIWRELAWRLDDGLAQQVVDGWIQFNVRLEDVVAQVPTP